MVILLVLLLASPDLRCAPSSEIHLSSSPPDPWSPQRDLCFSAQRSEQPDVGDRRNHVHKSQRPRRPSRSARQGNRKERKKQTDGSDAPEDADRAPGEPTDDGEYGSRANSTGHTGAHDLAKQPAASTPTRNRRPAGPRPDATELGATNPISTSSKVVAIACTAVYMSFPYYVKYKLHLLE